MARIDVARFTPAVRSQLVDEPPSLTVEALAPGRRVIVRASCEDATGVQFSSWAEYTADDKGSVQIATAAPHAGTFDAVDAYGLWWSMRGDERQPFTLSLDGVPTSVAAYVDGEAVAHATIDRVFAVPGMRSTPFREGDVIGELFLPAVVPAPAVITLGGSGGGLHWAEPMAALLAAHGYVALALAYFGMPGLPPSLAEVPVEYVHRAAAALLHHDAVIGEGIGVIGTSRGAELGLLAASLDPAISAIVGYCASTVLWGSVDTEQTEPRSAWTVGGKPAGYVVPDSRVIDRALSRPTIRLASALGGALDAAIPRAAEIALERIRGAVLFVSGGDDRMWPSSRLATFGMERLAAHRHPFERVHLRYAGAGHALSQIPGLPVAETTVRHPVDGEMYELGGTRAANAAAALDAWPRVLQFLARNLGAERRASAATSR